MAALVAPRRAPWATWGEWCDVWGSLWWCGDPSRLEWAVERMQAWRRRERLPVAVETTVHLLQLLVTDPGIGKDVADNRKWNSVIEWLSTSDEDEECAEWQSTGEDLDLFAHKETHRLAYSMALVRLVNGVADANQRGRSATSVATLAERVGLPRTLVDLRHAASHTHTPSLISLRSAVRVALEWARSSYWDAQLVSLQTSADPTPWWDALQTIMSHGSSLFPGIHPDGDSLGGRFPPSLDESRGKATRWVASNIKNCPHVVRSLLVPLLLDGIVSWPCTGMYDSSRVGGLEEGTVPSGFLVPSGDEFAELYPGVVGGRGLLRSLWAPCLRAWQEAEPSFLPGLLRGVVERLVEEPLEWMSAGERQLWESAWLVAENGRDEAGCLWCGSAGALDLAHSLWTSAPPGIAPPLRRRWTFLWDWCLFLTSRGWLHGWFGTGPISGSAAAWERSAPSAWLGLGDDNRDDDKEEADEEEEDDQQEDVREEEDEDEDVDAAESSPTNSISDSTGWDSFERIPFTPAKETRTPISTGSFAGPLVAAAGETEEETAPSMKRAHSVGSEQGRRGAKSVPWHRRRRAPDMQGRVLLRYLSRETHLFAKCARQRFAGGSETHDTRAQTDCGDGPLSLDRIEAMLGLRGADESGASSAVEASAMNATAPGHGADGSIDPLVWDAAPTEKSDVPRWEEAPVTWDTHAPPGCLTDGRVIVERWVGD